MSNTERTGPRMKHGYESAVDEIAEHGAAALRETKTRVDDVVTDARAKADETLDRARDVRETRRRRDPSVGPNTPVHDTRDRWPSRICLRRDAAAVEALRQKTSADSGAAAKRRGTHSLSADCSQAGRSGAA
jgi:hypothetical protein